METTLRNEEISFSWGDSCRIIEIFKGEFGNPEKKQEKETVYGNFPISNIHTPTFGTEHRNR